MSMRRRSFSFMMHQARRPDRPRGPSGLCQLSDAALSRAPFTCVHTLQGPAFALLKQVASAEHTEHTAVQRRVRGREADQNHAGMKGLGTELLTGVWRLENKLV